MTHPLPVLKLNCSSLQTLSTASLSIKLLSNLLPTETRLVLWYLPHSLLADVACAIWQAKHLIIVSLYICVQQNILPQFSLIFVHKSWFFMTKITLTYATFSLFLSTRVTTAVAVAVPKTDLIKLRFLFTVLALSIWTTLSTLHLLQEVTDGASSTIGNKSTQRRIRCRTGKNERRRRTGCTILVLVKNCVSGPTLPILLESIKIKQTLIIAKVLSSKYALKWKTEKLHYIRSISKMGKDTKIVNRCEFSILKISDEQ